MDHRIASMVCRACGDPAEFMISVPNGVVCVDKDGTITHSDDASIKTMAQLIKVLKAQAKRSKAAFEPEPYLFSCNTCEEECSANVTFKDGTATTNEELAFRKAFLNVLDNPAAKTTTPGAAPKASKGEIRTEDCIAYAIDQLGSLFDLPSSPKSWKRRSKKKLGDSIERRFEVEGLEQMVVVVERAGVIIEARVEDA